MAMGHELRFLQTRSFRAYGRSAERGPVSLGRWRRGTRCSSTEVQRAGRAHWIPGPEGWCGNEPYPACLRLARIAMGFLPPSYPQHDDVNDLRRPSTYTRSASSFGNAYESARHPVMSSVFKTADGALCVPWWVRLPCTLAKSRASAC